MKQQESELSGKIVEWDRLKGFGFLLAGKNRVFLHRRDFSEHHKKPEIGDAIRFALGKDPKGRACAVNAVHVNDGGRVTMLTLLLLAALLVLPLVALYQLGVNLVWVAICIVSMSVITYLVYRVDKSKARNKEWRISEGALHVFEILGGWPGALLAQRQLRHKCSKAGYQLVFWTIVLSHQFLSVDSLRNWQLSRAASQHLQSWSESAR